MAPAREIQIDRDLCMGSAQCTLRAPKTFELDDDTIAFVIDPAGDHEAAIAGAAEGCPTGAISLGEVTP